MDCPPSPVFQGWTTLKSERLLELSASPFDPHLFPQAELVDGLAPTGAPVEWVAESSYFFRLSAYKERLEEHIRSNPNFILPASRRNEVRNSWKMNHPIQTLFQPIKTTSFFSPSYPFGIRL